MGKVEKIVVLSVLFLITLILVVSLSSTVEDPAAGQQGTSIARASAPASLPGPAAGRDELQRQASAVPAPAERAEPNERGAERPGTLLDSSVQRAAPAAPVAASAPTAPTAMAAALPAGSILVTDEGLLPSYLDDYRFYAWRQGDTWETVAVRYFGNGRVGLLRRANEGRERVAPGEKILVPVFDLGGASETAAAVIPIAVDAASAPQAAATARPVASGTAYTVQEGDSLWRIAKKVYGEGSRWQAIFDANRDVLATADDLAAGQTLRIP